MKNFLKDVGIFLGIAIAFLGACIAYLVAWYPLAIITGGVGAVITVYSAVLNGIFSGK